ncbi:nicotinate-nucleotide diphosphorylase (carboxylating), partial [Arthrospira platensis SPKY1]|nr:nicotinate-nucleotide diphosphorylase (carboxylating) [Arthrospira platensis SPKY1]
TTLLAQAIQHDVRKALDEDVGTGDLTAALISPHMQAHARVLAREAAVICGRPWVEATLQAIDPSVQVIWHVAEGQRCAPNSVVLELQGKAQSILTAERTVLNFMQTLSAVATKVALYVARVAGTR